ncbi:MAG: methylated-DNA--[protein]-cysteine S-methyltransferase, partial [Pseudomonadales bacterium]|nr:methylated-DNA--[protein]-cysteine S-methyltransferase [Pseudomonadales bacterium]
QDGPEPMFPERGWRKDAAYFVNAIVQLNEYFAGQRTRFALRLNPEATEFQLRVLETLARIPYGQTASYADIARLLKKPRAVRAVGAANRKNPLPIMLPCHRVIGSDGSLTGFIGGLERKKWLINLEAETLQARGSRSEKSQQADQAVPA